MRFRSRIGKVTCAIAVPLAKLTKEKLISQLPD
jgi:hypothetical protein